MTACLAAAFGAVLNWNAITCHAATLTSPVNAVASMNRLGVGQDGPGGGTSGGSLNTIGGWGFPGNVIDVAVNPSDTSQLEWYVLGPVGGFPPQQLYYDLGATMLLESIVIWNDDDGNDVSQITQIDVGTTAGSPASFTLANMAGLSWTNNINNQGVAVNTGLGQVFSFGSPVLTRYLRLNIDGQLGGSTEGFYGFNEFAVMVVPEPQSLALFGVGLAALCGYVARRRKA
jgi:hypothetical protein